MRGIKTHIQQELFAITYDSLNTFMSHALSIEGCKSYFSRKIPSFRSSSTSVSMDISNARLGLTGQKKKDYDKDACLFSIRKGVEETYSQSAIIFRILL